MADLPSPARVAREFSAAGVVVTRVRRRWRTRTEKH